MIDPPPFSGDAALRARLAGKRVLVAGADGFLGTNCVRGLEALGVPASVVSRRDRAPGSRATGRHIRGDLMDPLVAEQAVAGHDIVFDLLGYPKLAPSSKAPQRELEQEFIPHVNLFQACSRSPARPLVFLCSSRLVYGTPQYLPVDEKHPVMPRSFYAAHKMLLEHYLGVMAKTDGLRNIVFRLSSPYGPFAPDRQASYGVLNMFMQMLMRGETVKLFGDGSQERDYVYVDDVIHAFLWSVVEPRCENETFNFGGDRAVSLAEAARSIAAIAGSGKIEHIPWPTVEKSQETGSYCSDNRKLHSMTPLGQQVPFDEGLRRTMNHLKSQKAGQSP